MTPPLDAYDAPPNVSRVGDDVLIRSPAVKPATPLRR